jgi:hypothetical protein
MLEIVKFETQNLQDIPEQDNPVFDYIKNDRVLGRRNECLMICKVLRYEEMSVGKNGFIVIYVPKQGEIRRIGLFWNFKNAETFAEAVSQNGL